MPMKYEQARSCNSKYYPLKVYGGGGGGGGEQLGD